MTADIREARKRRHERIRKKVAGTTERPRLSVYRSLDHMYAQIMMTIVNRQLSQPQALIRNLRIKKSHKGNIATAKQVGEFIAKKALGKGIKRLFLTGGGYLYHGRVKALAEAAREAGLEF